MPARSSRDGGVSCRWTRGADVQAAGRERALPLHGISIHLEGTSMSFTSHLFAIAAGVAAVTLYHRARESGALSLGLSDGNGATAGNDLTGGMMKDSLEGADSMNAGERIGAQGVGQGPLSSDSPEHLRSSDSMFASSSQTGSQARAPGLADLTRGA